MVNRLRTREGLAIELDRDVGSGAFGRVRHGVLASPWREWPAGTEVAVKRLHAHLSGDHHARRSLESEIEVLREVRHRALVRAVASGEDEDGPFLAMEFLAGRTLRELLVSVGPLPEPLVRSVAARVSGALAALHAAGFVHADVKPDNLRLDARGEAVLMDLGFAQRIRGRTLASARRPLAAVAPEGMAMPAPELAHTESVNPGSLAYLAPERARGLPCTPASDVFALGIVLYELATGVHPWIDDPAAAGPSIDGSGFSSGNLLQRGIEDPGADRLLAAIATARFVPPSRLVPQVSPFLDAMLQDLLRRDPQARPGAPDLAERFASAESGSWWRDQIDFGATARRGTLGEVDSTHLTPLAGRKRELARLIELGHEAFGTAGASDGGGARLGRAVWLLGPSGSGKSRLMSECATAIRGSIDPPPLYLYARCPAFEESRPHSATLRLLERYLRLPSGGVPSARQREQLARTVPPRIAGALAAALSPGAKPSADVATPIALAEWLIALGRQQPLLVFLDDLNFADEGTLATLAHVTAELASTRMLLVLGLRDHEEVYAAESLAKLRSAFERAGNASEIALGPLDEEDVQELAHSLFHHSQPRRRIAQVLYARSRGNPGLIAEILRGLIERGEARPFGPGETKLVLDVPPERLPLPESLHTMIQERFAKASEADREWLQRLSVAGGRIESGFLARAFPDASAGEIDAELARLFHSGWLAAAGDRYRFARPALREAVYRTLGPEQRRKLHSQAADAFSASGTEGGERAGRISVADAFQRAFHLRAAERHSDLLRLLRPLIQALLTRGQPQRVYVLARWGLDALGQLPRTRSRDRRRIEFLEAAADATDRLGARGEQRLWLDALSDLEFDPERDPDALARVYLLHGRYAAGTGQYGLARGMYRNAVELAGQSDSPELHSEALRRLGAVQAHVGELEEARELLVRSLERAVHDPQRAVTLIQLGIVELLENRLEDALRCVDRALRLQRRTRRFHLPGITAAAHMLRGRIYRVCGRPARALGSMKRAVTLARQAGERRLEMEATARLGGLLLDLDQPEDAEASLREALLIAGEIEDRRGQTLALLWLGTLLWEQSDPEAANVLDRALALAHEMGLRRAESIALAIRSRIAREAGQTEQALELSATASELLRQQGAELPDRIVVVGTRALVLHTAGRHDEAAEMIKDLRRKMRRDNERIENPELRRAHRNATTRLLEAVLSPEGVIYPRVAE